MVIPKVIIDLSKKQGSYEGDPLTTGKLIKVTGSGIYSDFLKYEHTLETENKPFQFTKIQDDQNGTVSGAKGGDVTSVSAYYWKDKLSKVLLVGVTTEGRSTNYYRNSQNGTWNNYDLKAPENGPTKEDLELLNCEINDAVTIDISYETSTAQNSYCCEQHKKGSGMVSVDQVPIRCTEHQSSSTITAYKHSITSGTQIAGIRYNEHSGGDRVKTTVSGLQISYLWCQSVSAFYCGKNPLLIYIGGYTATGWYKKNKVDSQPWEQFQGISENIIPNNITDCTHDDFNELVKALREATGCPDLQECPPPPPQQQAAAMQGGPSTGTSPLFPGDKYVFGTLATVVSGLVGFAGFKFYKSRSGDPWVRQI